MEFSITFANVVYKTRVGVSPSNRNTLLNTPHTVNVCFACACQKNLPSISIGLSLSFSLFLFLSLSLTHAGAYSSSIVPTFVVRESTLFAYDSCFTENRMVPFRESTSYGTFRSNDDDSFPAEGTFYGITIATVCLIYARRSLFAN